MQNWLYNNILHMKISQITVHNCGTVSLYMHIYILLVYTYIAMYCQFVPVQPYTVSLSLGTAHLQFDTCL